MKFLQIHPGCIWAGQNSGSLLAPGMLWFKQVTTQGARAQTPEPSRAGRRVPGKIFIEPVQK